MKLKEKVADEYVYSLCLEYIVLSGAEESCYLAGFEKALELAREAIVHSHDPLVALGFVGKEEIE